MSRKPSKVKTEPFVPPGPLDTFTDEELRREIDARAKAREEEKRRQKIEQNALLFKHIDLLIALTPKHWNPRSHGYEDADQCGEDNQDHTGRCLRCTLLYAKLIGRLNEGFSLEGIAAYPDDSELFAGRWP